MRVKMHDLIRDMALHIMNATSIVKARKGLTRIPCEDFWTDALEKVSLMQNHFEGFLLNMSPNCPKLSTILLNGSLNGDVVICDSFFKKLSGLKILNLSGCDLRELPNSISDLVNLRALLLGQCRKLRRIPYLGKLRSLRKLDASDCVSLEVLEGLDMLVNLRYLDLFCTRRKRLPKGTLGGLLNLQFLKVWAAHPEEVAKLWPLESFECSFQHVDDLNEVVRLIDQRGNPCNYWLRVDQEKSIYYVNTSEDARFGNFGRRFDILKWSYAIVSEGGESSGICILIPKNVRTLMMRKCDHTTNLCGMGPLEHLEELIIEEGKNLSVLSGGQDEKVINIHDSPAPAPRLMLFLSLRLLKISQCPKLRYLFGHGSIFSLPHLREIEINECKEMVGITAAITSEPSRPLPTFPNLQLISVAWCDQMKRVVESEWLFHFPNLRNIRVFFCENMKEIIGCPPPHMPVEEISLESLTILRCDNMRRLCPHESFIHLQNLRNIEVRSCKGMVEMISGARQDLKGSIMTLVNDTPPSFQSSISLPKLERLVLYNLPQLKSICEVPIICDSRRDVQVSECPELNEIPLQPQSRDNEPLPYIEVRGQEK
ncbi:hypothetical protein BT93_F1124 [Corymbia citriodora subsp. variegata]|nr:hypothetical protein BT93_F1124 [Corymbia citriodora subsp. variegata]